MKMPDVTPLSWKVGAPLALLVLLFSLDAWRVHEADQAGYKRANAERAARDAVAVLAKVHDDAAAAVKNTNINAFLTKDHNEKLEPVVRTIYVDRVRIGPAICGAATTAQAENAGSGDGTDSSRRLVQPDIERDIRALMVDVETDLATGRSCQEFGKLHGYIE